MEVRPHSTVGFHETVHVRLVFRRRVRGRIVMRADDTERRLPDGVEQIVVEDVAGADQADPGLTQSTLRKLLENGGALARGNEYEQGIRLGVLDALEERRVVRTAQGSAKRVAHSPPAVRKALVE